MRSSTAVWRVAFLALVATAGLLLAGAAPKGGGKAKPEPPKPKPEAPKAEGPRGVTEETVNRAIEKGREYLLNHQAGNGSWPGGGGHSALVFMTLAYMGQHPNHVVMTRGLDYLLALDPKTGFGGRQGYGVPIRIMGLSYIHNKLLGEKRVKVRHQMFEDIQVLMAGQNAEGGWRYKLDASDYDFSVSQWPLLAMREADLVGIEFNGVPAQKARELYNKYQQKDGGWCYQAEKKPSYGSMTAAGLASLYIISDVLEPASGCPCAGGKSQRETSDTERRLEMALGWLAKNFTAAENPHKETGENRPLYWLYCVERVGIAAGYKYFGNHNWFHEGAAHILRGQKDGHWDTLDDTCFALLFLYKGRAPILFNKLKFDGEWNSHRRDMANLTNYIERTKEQQFHWQIVELKSSLEELHDAPILYITPETLPKWGEAEKKKLRAFTDTGGTILLEASCGNPPVRKWFMDFAKDVWPEWPVAKLNNEHGVWKSPYDMKEKPEILGIDDGVRTAVFYSPDDISCSWQTRALASKAYLFNWGINLYTYATDGAPLRSKLADREPEQTGRYKHAVKVGAKNLLKVARVQYGGNWEVGANYGGLKSLAARVKEKTGITLETKEDTSPPVSGGGTATKNLRGHDVAYLAGSATFTLTPAEKEGLKDYAAGGGFLWVESVTGSSDFDTAFRKAAEGMGWELKLLPKEHPLMTGKMDGATGYNLTADVEFRTALRVARLGRQTAEFYGIYVGEKMIGVYSPLDVVFSAKGLEAYKCRGYKAEDAIAVATNLTLFFSTLK